MRPGQVTDVVLLALRGVATDRLTDEHLFQYQYITDRFLRDEPAYQAIKADVVGLVVTGGGDPATVMTYAFSSRYLLDVVRLHWRERHIQPIDVGVGAIVATALAAKEVDSAQGERHLGTGAP